MQVTLHDKRIVMQVTLHDKRIVMQVTLHYEAILTQVTLHDKSIIMQVTLHYEAIVMQVTLHDKRIVVIPSESEDERECDVPVCNDFTTFSNLLFDADDDFSYNTLLNQNSLIISSLKIDSLLDEFVGELILLKSILPVIDEADCDPEEEIHIIEKLFYDTSPPHIEDDDYDSEGDLIILEEFFSNDSLSLPENESFHFDIPSSPRPPAKPLDDDEIEPNSRMLTVKVVVIFLNSLFLFLYFFPPNPPTFQIRINLLIFYLIGALKLFSFLLNAR
nr:hypothetical protein [Tanacetum cinerariifolium]